MRSTRRRTAAAVGLILVATAALAGCGDGDVDVSSGGDKSVSASSSPEAVTNEVTITGVDYGYILDKPAVDSGSFKITFVNGGKDVHMLGIGAMAPGKTLAELNTALGTRSEDDDNAIVPAFDDDNAGPFGMPLPLTPGSKTASWLDLAPGTYALVCFFRTSDGKPHFSAGMVNQLVVNETATTAPEPTPTAEATLEDGKLTLPDLSSGKAVIKVTNAGKTDHDFTIIASPAGKTFDQSVTALDTYFQGRAKVDTIGGLLQGGVSTIKPGASAFVEVDLKPGTYYAVCMESDTDEDGKEHFRTGTEKAEFKVV